jgi:hypothetical protein
MISHIQFSYRSHGDEQQADKQIFQVDNLIMYVGRLRNVIWTFLT